MSLQNFVISLDLLYGKLMNGTNACLILSGIFCRENKAAIFPEILKITVEEGKFSVFSLSIHCMPYGHSLNVIFKLHWKLKIVSMLTKSCNLMQSRNCLYIHINTFNTINIGAAS